MRLMGEQNSSPAARIEDGDQDAAAVGAEARGFTSLFALSGKSSNNHRGQHSSPMRRAVHAIGKASHRRGIYEGPGVSIKLSALHPRYQRISGRA